MSYIALNAFTFGEVDIQKATPNTNTSDSMTVVKSDQKTELTTGTPIRTEADQLLAAKMIAEATKKEPPGVLDKAEDFEEDLNKKEDKLREWDRVAQKELNAINKVTRRSLASWARESVSKRKREKAIARGMNPYRRGKKMREADNSELAWWEKALAIGMLCLRLYEWVKSIIRWVKNKIVGFMRWINKQMKNINAKLREAQRAINLAKAEPGEWAQLLSIKQFTREFERIKKTALAFMTLGRGLLVSLGMMGEDESNSTGTKALSEDEEAETIGTILDDQTVELTAEDYDTLIDTAVAAGKAKAVKTILMKSPDWYIPSRMRSQMQTLALTMKAKNINNDIYYSIFDLKLSNNSTSKVGGLTMLDIISTGSEFTYEAVPATTEPVAPAVTYTSKVIDGLAVIKIGLMNGKLIPTKVNGSFGSLLQAGMQALAPRMIAATAQ